MITSFSHIYLPVRDVDEAIEFYTKNLNFRLLRKYHRTDGRREGGRLQMVTVMVISMVEGGPVVTRFCSRRRIVAVSETRSRSDRGRERDDTHCAQQDHRTCEGRYRLSAETAIPHPTGPHHNVDLKQQCTEVRGCHQFGLPGVWTDRSTRSAR